MNINLKIGPLKTKLDKYIKLLSKHAAFAITLIILLTYIFIVWRISSLGTAEPNEDDSSSLISNSIPKIDQKAINQILSLEQNNTQIHSLFKKARNNPFQE